MWFKFTPNCFFGRKKNIFCQGTSKMFSFYEVLLFTLFFMKAKGRTEKGLLWWNRWVWYKHRGKTVSGPRVSRPNNGSTDFNISQWDKKILRALEISDKGFMVNQNLKRVTKPKFELQPHLARQQKVFSERTFFT